MTTIPDEPRNLIAEAEAEGGTQRQQMWTRDPQTGRAIEPKLPDRYRATGRTNTPANTPPAKQSAEDFLGAAPDPATAPKADDFLNGKPQTVVGGLAAGKKADPAQVKADMTSRATALKAKTDKAMGRDPDVDYQSGLSFGDRIAMAKLDNDAERKMYLERRYGEGSVSTDQRGRLVVKKDDKKTAVGKPGAVPTLIGEATPLGAGSVGAAMGSELGPFGAMIGFGLGAGAGTAIDQIIKSAYGLNSLTPAEQGKKIVHETEMGMVGEGAGRLGGKAINRATRGPVPRMLGGQTTESQRLTDLTTSGGAAPPFRSALPDAKRLQWHQMLGRKVTGKTTAQEEGNQKFIDTELKNILRESGIPADKIDEVFEAVANPKAALSTREMGEDIKNTVTAHADTLRAVADQENKQISDAVDTQFKHINDIITRFKPGDLGVDVGEGIGMARKQFSRAMEKPYNRVDKLVGDEKLVPTAKIKQQVQQVLKSLPPNKEGEPILSDPRVLKALNELNGLDEKISFGEAQKIRTTLGELGEIKDLVPGVSKHQYNELRNSVNIAFKQAGADPRAAAAKRLLDQADGLYSKGIKKFEDTTVNKLVREAETGIVPDAGKIAETITQAGYTQRADTIKGLVGEKVWKQVAAADWKNMVEDVTRALPDQGDMIDGKVFRRMLRDRGQMIDTVYGPKLAKEMRTYADHLAAKDGKIPAEALEPGNFKQMVQARDAAEAGVDKFMKENFLAALSDPKKMPDVALDWIVKPAQESRLMQAFEFFGEGSPQVTSIRQAALRDLLQRASATTETGVGRRVSAEGIEKAMQQLTTKQQEMLFPNGLADDIRLVAQETKFLYPFQELDLEAGRAAGVIKALPLVVYAPIAAYLGVMNRIFGDPKVVRFLALGLRGDSKARETAIRAVRVLSRTSALGMQGDTQHKETP